MDSKLVVDESISRLLHVRAVCHPSGLYKDSARQSPPLGPFYSASSGLHICIG